jgi:asparagine synthase (glutamine-hydrolysing)
LTDELKRSLVGVFDAHESSSARLPDALAKSDRPRYESAALTVAFSGPPAPAGDPLCLLDGRLDNLQALARELGVSSNGAPERVIVAAWRRWREGLAARLRGDFAVLVWDARRGEGLLARDQLGVRSVYLSQAGGRLCFAGEVRDLLKLLARRPSPDPVGVAHWLAMRGRPGAGTLYDGVRRLEPGCMLLLARRGAAREERYWAPRFHEPTRLPAPEVFELVRESIGAAVRRRVATTGKTGVMMSGGLDSASVAAIAATTAEGPIEAYSATFPEHDEIDESHLIEQLRDELGLGGANAVVRPGGMLDSTIDATREWALPLASWGDFWAIPLLRAAAAAGVEAMLGGDGGDELFGARLGLLADQLRAGRLRRALVLTRELPGAGARPSRRELARAFAEFGALGALPRALHEPARRISDRRAAPHWLRPRLSRALAESADPYAWKRYDGPRWWSSAAHVLTRGVEEAGLFEEHRRRAATAGVQARHPLYDLDVLELALAQQPQATFDRERDRPVLRASMQGVVPDAVRLRGRKARFDSLLVDSLAGSDLQGVRSLLADPRAELGAFVDLASLRERLPTGDPSESFSAPWIQQLWRLASLECWLRSQSDDGRLRVIPRANADVTIAPAARPQEASGSQTIR